MPPQQLRGAPLHFLDELDLVAVRIADGQRASVHPAPDVIGLAVVVRNLDAEIPDRFARAIEIVHDEAPAARQRRPLPVSVVLVHGNQRPGAGECRGAARQAVTGSHELQTEYARVESHGAIDVTHRERHTGDLAHCKPQRLARGPADELADSYHAILLSFARRGRRKLGRARRRNCIHTTDHAWSFPVTGYRHAAGKKYPLAQPLPAALRIGSGTATAAIGNEPHEKVRREKNTTRAPTS